MKKDGSIDITVMSFAQRDKRQRETLEFRSERKTKTKQLNHLVGRKKEIL